MGGSAQFFRGIGGFCDFCESVCLLKKQMPKKVVARKHPRGLSSSKYDHSRLVSADAEGRFHASVTRCSGSSEKGIDIDEENTKVEDFQRVIHSRGWQLFCKHPNATAMMVVREFFVNAPECTSRYTVFVRGKQVKHDMATINHLLRLSYKPSGPDEVEYMMNKANMEEVSRAI